MLKKLAITIAIVTVAANAFAAATAKTDAISNAASWAAANIKFLPSKSVILAYSGGVPADAAGSTNNSVYSISSKNSAGDNTYAATSASTTIVFSKGKLAGADNDATTLPTLPSDPSDSSITGGAGNWSVL